MRLLCIALGLVGGVIAHTALAESDSGPVAEVSALNAVAEPTEAAFARKDRSEAVLLAEGIPVDVSLPPIVDARQALPRSHEEVVRRTLAVLATAIKGEGAAQEKIERLLDDFGVRSDLSDDEAAFISNQSPSTLDRIRYAWRYEAAWTFVWALSLVDTLEPPREIVQMRKLGKHLQGKTVDTLLATSELRPIDDILDQADLIYRYRNAITQAVQQDRDLPAGLDPGIAEERYRALYWLIGNLGQDWDEIDPDR